MSEKDSKYLAAEKITGLLIETENEFETAMNAYLFAQALAKALGGNDDETKIVVAEYNPIPRLIIADNLEQALEQDYKRLREDPIIGIAVHSRNDAVLSKFRYKTKKVSIYSLRHEDFTNRFFLLETQFTPDITLLQLFESSNFYEKVLKPKQIILRNASGVFCNLNQIIPVTSEVIYDPQRKKYQASIPLTGVESNILVPPFGADHKTRKVDKNVKRILDLMGMSSNDIEGIGFLHEIGHTRQVVANGVDGIPTSLYRINPLIFEKDASFFALNIYRQLRSLGFDLYPNYTPVQVINLIEFYLTGSNPDNKYQLEKNARMLKPFMKS